MTQEEVTHLMKEGRFLGKIGVGELVLKVGVGVDGQRLLQRQERCCQN